MSKTSPVKVIDMFFNTFPLKATPANKFDHVEVLYIMDGSEAKVAGEFMAL